MLTKDDMCKEMGNYQLFFHRFDNYSHLIIYGAGGYGKTIYNVMKNIINIKSFIDNNLKKQQEGYLGLPVYPEHELGNLVTNDSALIIGFRAKEEVDDLLNKLETKYNFKRNENLFSEEVFENILSEEYLKMIYRTEFGKELNFENPKTYNEKLQWLKLYNQKPEYTNMADKYKVRKIIADKIGEEYLIPLLGVYDKFEDIKFDKLPNQFVLKCNHDCNSVQICKDKKVFDFAYAGLILNKCLKLNYYPHSREFVYKNIKPCIIAEQYLGEVYDYRFFTFNGSVKVIGVYSGFSNVNIYDPNWEYIPMSLNNYPTDPNHTVEKPYKLNEMIKLAETLSDGIPFLRVDFYYVNNKIYFGELTFYPSNGWTIFNPERWNEIFGSYLKLPKKKVISAC